MDIQRLLGLASGIPQDDVLGMILSNRIDTGSAAGGLISAAQFSILIKDILAWHAALAVMPSNPQLTKDDHA